MRLLEWSYNRRGSSEYSQLFTADYQFVFAANDTSGNAFHDIPFALTDELTSTNHLFAGGDPSQPAAGSINLIFDRRFEIAPDSRAGKDSTVHKTIGTTVILTINFTDGTQTEIRGRAIFFVVRGDSASIPADLQKLGFTGDPGRWYIERWDDETLGDAIPGIPAGAARTMPSRRATWGGLKARYR